MEIKKLTSKQFADRCEAVAKKAGTLQAEIHELAMFALYHCNKFTNTDPANRLLSSLPKGQRVLALRHWFVTYGCCNVKDDKLAFAKKAKLTAPETFDVNLQTANDTPYWALSAEKEPVSFRFGAEELLKQIQRAKAIEEDAEKAAKYKAVEVDDELLEKVAAVIQAHIQAQLEEEAEEIPAEV